MPPPESTTSSRRPPLAVRRIGPEDLDDVCDLRAACDRAVLGFRDFTPAGVAADLRRADLEAYGWYDDRATLRGCGWLERTGASNQVELDVYVRPGHHDHLGPEILARLEGRGRELAAEAGHAEPWLGTATYRTDARTRGWLEAAGYEVRTMFTRLRIDLDTSAPDTSAPDTSAPDTSAPDTSAPDTSAPDTSAPDTSAPDTSAPEGGGVPPAVVIRRVTAETDLRAAHDIEEEAFREHYGNVPISFSAWRERLTARGPQFAQVFLAELDGTPVALMVTSRRFEANENADYIQTLGVLPAARGRGVASALLRHCFAAAGRAGRAAVLLHVDVANVTGALRLYESVGMRTVLEIDAWAKGERTG